MPIAIVVPHCRASAVAAAAITLRPIATAARHRPSEKAVRKSRQTAFASEPSECPTAAAALYAVDDARPADLDFETGVLAFDMTDRLFFELLAFALDEARFFGVYALSCFFVI